MSTTTAHGKKTLLEMAETMHVKDTITFQINSEFLNHNFMLIKECLLKVQQLQNGLNSEHETQGSLTKEFRDLQQKVSNQETQLRDHDGQIKQLQNNIGDDFMKKIYDLETKTQNTYDFDETVRRLEGLDKFVTADTYRSGQEHIRGVEQEIEKVKDELNRYVETVAIDQFKENVLREIEELNVAIKNLHQVNAAADQRMDSISEQCDRAREEVNENNQMLKQINFTEMQERLKKFKDDTDHKIGEVSLRLKKKCGLSDLGEFEKTIVERLDKFLTQNEKGKAGLSETKDALVYLEKRVNQIYDILSAKESEEENDALFSTKKVHCASCTKDMGKFEGKLGQFRPWAVFPCKELEPEKTGGYGYLNYIDKLAYKRGSTSEDEHFERLSKTFYERNKEEDSPRKVSTARTTNFMSSYGEESRQISSLKEEYFKDLKSERNGTVSKIFRVKRDSTTKPNTTMHQGSKGKEV